MKKILITLIILLVAIPIAGLVAINFLIDPNDLKPIIVDKAREATGGELTINGDIGWSFFPSVGLSVSDLHFTTAKNTDSPMMTLKTAHFSVELLPLFKGQANVGGISVSDA